MLRQGGDALAAPFLFPNHCAGQLGAGDQLAVVAIDRNFPDMFAFPDMDGLAYSRDLALGDGT